MNTTKMTVQQAAFLADQAGRKFQLAAEAWVSGNNSGTQAGMDRGDKRCDKLRREAEAMLEPLGIKCDYPGLYPSFTVRGFHHYDTLSAISAALETEKDAPRKERAA